jgi:CheY-like chemotaxis protein
MKNDVRILFLDDDKFIHALLEYELENNAYNFILDNKLCPHDAIQSVKDNEYDCIITDFRMPELNGREFIDAISELNKKLPPIIGYTGESNPREAFGSHPTVVNVFAKEKLTECLEFVNNEIAS